MSGNHRGPFTRAGVIVLNGNKHEVCRCVGQCEAEDVVTALNMWAYQPDVPPKSEPGGICDKCLGLHRSAFVGQKCISSKDCGGTVQDIKTPQPNREETDKIAAKYYESGRKLDIQCWSLCAGGAKGYWKDVEFPSFSYDYVWRIKPSKRRVVVGIFKNLSGQLYSAMLGDGTLYPAALATAECEVEA